MLFITEESDFSYKGRIQILYFYTIWLPFKRKTLLMLEKAEEKYKDIAFFAIDVDHFPSFCKRFQIDTIPTVLFMVGGKEVKRISEVWETQLFMGAFADICNPESPNMEKSHA